jgi:pyridoxamine 5'-phosphate oxidase
MTVNVRHTYIGPEFTVPPADPIPLLRDWFALAIARDVDEPNAIALSTVAANGRPSSRMVHVHRITHRGLVVTSHTNSRKGQEIDQTRQWSGVTYWRETNQQITFGGHVEPADSGLSDVLWRQGPAPVRAMAVTTAQSEPLADQKSLLLRARTRQRLPLPRPRTWVAHHLVITEVEFWQSSPDALHRRLRYDLTDSGWRSVRLQP